MPRKEKWVDLKRRGDWIIERRTGKGEPAYVLCVMWNREESIELPEDLALLMIAGGVQITESTGWNE